VKKRFGLWFRLVISGTVPKPTPPSSFSPEQLQQMQVPVLAFFGTDDKVIGDAEKAIELSKNMPKARVKLVESGHLIAAELPEIVNPAILEFLAQ
jgi:pimeloyl-ACP methyl ester carboxylesterase